MRISYLRSRIPDPSNYPIKLIPVLELLTQQCCTETFLADMQRIKKVQIQTSSTVRSRTAQKVLSKCTWSIEKAIDILVRHTIYDYDNFVVQYLSVFY